MFEDMMRAIGGEIVHNIFHLNIERFDQHELEHKRELEMEQMSMRGASDTADNETAATPAQKNERTGRNEVCPCGSGKKYKKCCG